MASHCFNLQFSNNVSWEFSFPKWMAREGWNWVLQVSWAPERQLLRRKVLLRRTECSECIYKWLFPPLPARGDFSDHHYANLVWFLELKLIEVWVCPKTGPSGVAISNLSTPSLQKFVSYSVRFAPLVLFCSWICLCFSKMWFSVTGYLSFQFGGGGQKFIVWPQFSNEYKKMCRHLVSSALFLLVERKWLSPVLLQTRSETRSPCKYF